jgi:lipopolysaccharide transport system ATP-binding protein
VEPVIRAVGLSKEYRVASNRAPYRTLRESLADALRFGRGEARASERRFWALRDASFDVEAGEVVGVIGRNGAGKSTLLKILSRITRPTTGRCAITGRVGSLLEVGTGFHHELSGRENIFLNGAILGMRRQEIVRKFERIVEFAEVADFIDMPVKRYSSGMYLRLAFSVAAHLDPEILLVDEVLAVGDIAFQRKCLGKMGEVAGEGRTVLLVTHNMGAVSRICSRAIFVHEGRIRADGPVDGVLADYLDTYASHEGECVFPRSRRKPVEFVNARVLRPSGTPSSSFDVRYGITVALEYEVSRAAADATIGVRVSTRDGVAVFTTHHTDVGEVRADGVLAPGVHQARFTIPGNFLMPGSYLLSIGVVDARMRPIDLHEDALSFEVSETGSVRSHGLDTRSGIVGLELPWEFETLGVEVSA